MSDKVKQVIVVRKDLNMRTGKLAAQVAHASMKFILDGLMDTEVLHHYGFWTNHIGTGKAVDSWLKGCFTKIVLGVNSQEELERIYKEALLAGLDAYIIEDNGDTEFHGVKTKTAVAIGPDLSSKIDPITKDLKLI